MGSSWAKKGFTYCFDCLFVEGDFDVEVFEIVVRSSLARSSTLLVHGLTPAAVHLIVLLGLLLLIATLCLHLLHLHLHALHLSLLVSLVLLLDGTLLSFVLGSLLLLALVTAHSLLLLVLLLATLIVIALIACTIARIFVAHDFDSLCLEFSY